ncbi:MAG: sigma 54-interacting transcriptional regulator [Acidobacteriia bacterium]|nr:sigma 54-interacting transcriptional regulator [Terriglobia bacterium]
MEEDLPHATGLSCSPDTGGGCETGSHSALRDPYEIFLEIAGLIVRDDSSLDLFEDLAPLLQELAGCDFVNISLHDPTQNRMLNHFWKAGQEAGELDAFPVGECINGWVWQNQQALTISDLEHEARFPVCLSALRKHNVRSFASFPMSTALRHYGALGMGKSEKEAVGINHSQFLSRVAQMVALALENQYIHRTLHEQQERIQSLIAISQELSASLNLERLAPIIFTNLRRITNYDYAVLAMLEPGNRSLRIHAVDPIADCEPLVSEGQNIPLERALSAQAIATRNIIFLNAEDLDRLGTAIANKVRDAGVQSVCCVPLFSGSQALGALSCGSKRRNAFRPQDAEYLLQVAGQIAAALHNARAYREIDQLKDRLAQEKRYLEGEISSELRLDETIGNSGALKRVLDHAAIVADTDSNVLITGETGTGKERVARSIHSMSRRRDRNFIKLNCAAIPTGLLESELFGHEKGAFTGAVSQKVGRLELADKGTLFLDEVGEIPLELQPKLLRVLQDQEFERLGATRTIRVDVRVIAATNRDLLREVEDKRFRSDLYYRLHVFPLHLPPLRERREDIPLLIRYFVEKSAARLNKRIDFIPDEAVGAMLKWKWPGNIRELENFIERSVILSEGNTLRPPLSELRQEISRQQTDGDGTLRQIERDHIIEVLRQTRGILSGAAGAAARLGLKRTTLQYKMQKLGISRMDYLD